MHWRKAILVALATVACTGGSGSTTSIVIITTTTAIAPEGGSTTFAPLVECPEIPYTVSELPTRVTGEPAELGAIELDEFTAIGGTRSVFLVNSDGELAIALIRGTLPPVDWPGDRGVVDIDGIEGVVGPHEDGKWVAAWFENDGTDRCDRYTMVFYPPIESFEVETTMRGLFRN